MSGAWQWGRIQPFLAKRGYASLAINYRGHCGSAPVDNLAEVSFADFLDDARTAARFLDQPVVIGQSTGGLIAQKLAEENLVAAAVLSCSVPPAGILWKCATSAIDDLRRESANFRNQVVKPDRTEFDDLVYNRMPLELANSAFAQQVPESGRVLAELYNQEIEVDELQVSCPILSIVADTDRLVLPEVDLAIAKKYNGLSLVCPDRGHYALVYEPGWEPIAALVCSWIKEAVPLNR